jgi:protein-glutamine gamma-glutamyltransferase
MVSGEKRIDLLLLIVAHALVLSGLFCVILTHEIPTTLWLCALAAHPVSILIKPRQGGLFFNSLVILAFLYALLLLFVLETPFLVAFTQFLIVVQAVKLFHLQKAKDYFQLAGLSLLMVLAAAGLTSQLFYLFFLFLVLLFGIWFLFLLQLKRAREQHPDLPHPPPSLTSPSLFMGITGVALCSFVITILVFFTLPRITLSVSGRERWGETQSGFADVVDLNSIGPVRLDNRVVMRVELPQLSERPASPLYWRGMSFARWDGQIWGKEDTMMKKIPRWQGAVNLHQEAGNSKALYQIIMLEPLGTDVLFCLHPALELQGSFPYLLVDEGGGIHLPSTPQDRYNYEVYSAPESVKERYQGSVEKPAEIYLHLPKKKEPIVALGRQICAGARSSEEKVQRVIAYLQGNYTYSLNPKRDTRYLPLEDFLLHSREGYCEHFATAAAVLLRGVGVPTRLVSGFLQGEWNSLGRYFMVRQRDAHTWIEAYLPEKGWVPFDPTPPAEAQALVPAIASLYRYYDFFKLRWNRYIIRYSRRDQISILLALHQKIMGLRLFPEPSPFSGVREKAAKPSPYFLAAMALVACILFIAWRWKKRKGYAGIKRTAKLPAEILFYLKMLKILEKKKIPKQETETPLEFADRVGKRETAISPSLERITSLYYRVRFGRIPLTPHEEEEAGKIIRDLKKRAPLSPDQRVTSGAPIAGGS